MSTQICLVWNLKRADEMDLHRNVEISSERLKSSLFLLGLETGRRSRRSQVLGWHARLVHFCLLCVLASVCRTLATDSLSGPPPDANQVRSIYSAGMRLVQGGRFDEAIQTFKQGLQSEPRNTVLLNAIGSTYCLKDDTQQAEGYFLKALSTNPQFTPARKNLAIAYFNSGKYDLARAQFEQLGQSAANGLSPFLFLGMIAKKNGQYPEAVEFFEKSGTLAFQYPDSILSFARSLYKSSHELESESLLANLDRVKGVSAKQWFEAGRLYCSLGRFESALEDFGKARDLDPRLPNLDYLRSYALSRLGRSSDALRILQDLTARGPDPDPLNLLAHVAEDTGNVQLSLDAFKRAVDLAPDREENYLDYSTLCMGYGNSALALDVVKVGLQHINRSYRLTVQQGAILANLGKQEEAKAAFESAMKLQSDNKEAFLGLAVALTGMDRFDEAVRTYAEGIERFPSDFNLNYYYAFALFRIAQHHGLKGQSAEPVRQAIEKAIQLNRRFAGAYYLRAKFYTVIDPSPALAIENLESCLRLAPRYVPAKYQLALLYRTMGKNSESENLLKQVREIQAEELSKEQDHARIVINRGSPSQVVSGKELP
jgi:tetratricopeptide (TPR) repeat protein